MNKRIILIASLFYINSCNSDVGSLNPNNLTETDSIVGFENLDKETRDKRRTGKKLKLDLDTMLNEIINIKVDGETLSTSTGFINSFKGSEILLTNSNSKFFKITLINEVKGVSKNVGFLFLNVESDYKWDRSIGKEDIIMFSSKPDYLSIDDLIQKTTNSFNIFEYDNSAITELTNAFDIEGTDFSLLVKKDSLNNIDQYTLVKLKTFIDTNYLIENIEYYFPKMIDFSKISR